MLRKRDKMFLVLIFCVGLAYIGYLVFKATYSMNEELINRLNTPHTSSNEILLLYQRSKRNITAIINETKSKLRAVNDSLTRKQKEKRSKRRLLYLSKTCRPQKAVVFIKTHKTGSSTITNVINRYADLYNIKIALPLSNFYRFNWPKPFHWSTLDLWRLDGDVPAMLSNHARYKRVNLDLIMEKGAKYITILRNPVEQFESMFHYMDFNHFLKLNESQNPLETFLENPIPLLREVQQENKGLPEQMNLIKNPMTFDLGLYPPMYEDMSRVQQEVKKIDEEFELVLIMEYFDESLIVLKKLFCWNFIDIVYIKFNQRKQVKYYQLSNNVKTKIKQWNKADVLFYNHFNKTLWKNIQELGASFWNELEEFRELNAYYENICVDKTTLTQRRSQLLNNDILSYKLKRNVSNYYRYFCMKMLRDEISYIDYFRQKYKPYGSYQRLLEETGRKKQSTRELIERLQTVSKIKHAEGDSIPRAIS